MSTALTTALRESGGYLRDGGYEQTAQLVAAAADEIERLNRQVQMLESGVSARVAPRRRIDRLGQLIKPVPLTTSDPALGRK